MLMLSFLLKIFKCFAFVVGILNSSVHTFLMTFFASVIKTRSKIKAASFVATGWNMVQYELQRAKQALCIVTDCLFICSRLQDSHNYYLIRTVFKRL